MEPRDGDLAITDQAGAHPLQVKDDEDARIENLFLAAAAPALYDALGYVLNRMDALVERYSGQQHVDRKLLQAAHAAMIDARPRQEDFDRLKNRNRQRDLFSDAG